MTKYCYALYHVEGGFYNAPFVVDIAPDVFLESYKQGLYEGDVDYLQKLKVYDVKFLGTFDNVTGVITSCCDFICHLNDIVCPILLSKKGDLEDGTSKEDRSKA